eukprot:comp23926_c1_seq1/m.42241 comp23926_c1_seq1/g.42241  ORF comp23926_c1_seq1/g.42241 comp23926_c1_seq1/m.42241 type:complete len:216 (-) comp23926_c1_seq1:207-854(-)
MGKKMGVNEKAVVAKERDATKKADAKAKTQKAKEDKEWEDDDKNAAKKQAKKEAEDKKRAEAAARKAEAKTLLEAEEARLKSAKPSASKVTKHQIDTAKAKEEEERAKQAERERLARKNISVVDHADENVNRQVGEMLAEGHIVATGLDEALTQLTVSDKTDRFPEKRLKAAYTAYEAKRLPELKKENPSLRLTQLKEMLWKEWQKSPENPLNQQ